MRKTWGKLVGTLGTGLGINMATYPQAGPAGALPVGESTTFYTPNNQVLPLLTHSKNTLFSSVSRPLFHTIHKTYNKPLLNKLNFCI
jgi:hypothetical protein